MQTFLFLFATLTETALALRYELWDMDAACFWMYRGVMMVVQTLFALWTWKVSKYEKGKLALLPSEMEHYGSAKKKDDCDCPSSWIQLDRFNVNDALSPEGI